MYNLVVIIEPLNLTIGLDQMRYDGTCWSNGKK